MTINLYYLSNDEKQKTREIWEERFSEDSESFIDYYYEEKCTDNRIAALTKDDEIVSMLQLNPYDVEIDKSMYQLDYIVGVATKLSEQGYGYMGRLMTGVLEDSYNQRKPFCFLIPAIKELYERYGFCYVYDEYKCNPDLTCYKKIDFKEQSEITIEDLCDLIYKYRKDRYEIFVKPSVYYIERLIKELESENGHLYLLINEKKICGIFMEWGIEKPELRSLYIFDKSDEQNAMKTNNKEIKHSIMARITYLNEFIRPIHLKVDSKLDSMKILMILHDYKLAEQDGVYLWSINRKQSVVEKIDCESFETGFDVGFEKLGYKIININISQLTSWLFGYESIDSIMPLHPEWCNDIDVIKSICIDEVV